MKNILTLVVIFGVGCSNGIAADNGAGNGITAAQRAQVAAQVKALQKSKLQQADSANRNVKNAALRQGQAIDARVKQQHDEIDEFARNITPRYGPELTGNAAAVRKQQVSAEAQAEKARIAREARRKAESQRNAARKNAEGVNQTVEGLKSQVKKDGSFGLQPQGSNLYVRNYGK